MATLYLIKKFSDLSMRESLYAKKLENSKKTGAIPLVMDNNPALPNMAKIINKHKHLLDLHPALNCLIPKDRVFVTYRKNRTIGDTLIHNRYRPKSTALDTPSLSAIAADSEDSKRLEHDEGSGCVACEKCYVCKQGYLTPCEEYTSFHTDQIFYMKKRITCQSTGLIYLMECVSCRVSDVGYTTGNLPKRFSNHKSHIKRKVNSCRLAGHFLEVDHNIDYSKDCTLSCPKKIKLVKTSIIHH